MNEIRFFSFQTLCNELTIPRIFYQQLYYSYYSFNNARDRNFLIYKVLRLDVARTIANARGHAAVSLFGSVNFQ